MKSFAFLAPPDPSPESWCGWYDIDFEKGMRHAGVRAVTCPKIAALLHVGRVLRKLHLVRNLASGGRPAYLVTLSHVSEYKVFPATYFHEIIPYCFDCWPYRYDQWAAFFRRQDVRVAFFSARQSRDYFAERLPGLACYWVPEACDPATYGHDKPLRERSIDVLEFGRKFDPYHAAIAEPLRAQGRRHLWTAAQLSRGDFLRSLADARISIAFPRNITDPAYTGGVETVTVRYFEGMASRSLMVGHCPRELLDLLGYNPVVEADRDRPLDQIRQILASLDDYQPLVDRNYQAVLERGTWEARAAEMVRLLREHGYTP